MINRTACSKKRVFETEVAIGQSWCDVEEKH